MTDRIVLTTPSDARLRSVATLVVGGVGTRLELPYERVDDLQIAILSLLDASNGSDVSIEIERDDSGLGLTVGPLRPGSAHDGGLMAVLQPLVDAVRAEEREGFDWLALRLEAGG